MKKRQEEPHPRDRNEVFNGIHPGKAQYGPGGNEGRFALLIDDLIPYEFPYHRRTGTDYDWNLGQVKHTLKEFEKPIYYSMGDYKKAYTGKFSKNLLTGFMSIEK